MNEPSSPPQAHGVVLIDADDTLWENNRYFNRDVLRVGKERQRPLEMRGKLMIYDERLEQYWIPTSGEDNAELDEAGT